MLYRGRDREIVTITSNDSTLGLMFLFNKLRPSAWIIGMMKDVESSYLMLNLRIIRGTCVAQLGRHLTLDFGFR